MKKTHGQMIGIAASVRDRLYTSAKERNVDFNFVLRQYFQERFLFRLSKSVYAEHFILKGALLFWAYDISRNRPTQDVDFLGTKLRNNVEEIIAAVKAISQIQCDDGVTFSDVDIQVEKIKEGDEYEGRRVILLGRLGTVKNSLQLDIGFGDAIAGGPKIVRFPVMLEGEPLLLYVYPVESAIAEKFQTIVSLGKASSRMKDYFDILFLAEKISFDGERLFGAIQTTFGHRGTLLSDVQYIFNSDFRDNPELQLMWITFLKKRNLTSGKSFPEVIRNLEKFLLPCIQSIGESKTWDNKSLNWL